MEERRKRKEKEKGREEERKENRKEGQKMKLIEKKSSHLKWRKGGSGGDEKSGEV